MTPVQGLGITLMQESLDLERMAHLHTQCWVKSKPRVSMLSFIIGVYFKINCDILYISQINRLVTKTYFWPFWRTPCDCLLLTRGAFPHTRTRCIQPWESPTMQPAAQTSILHHGLSHTLPQCWLGPSSQQVLSTATYGRSSPKQGIQCKLHNIRWSQHRGTIWGFSQDSCALQIQ